MREPRMEHSDELLKKGEPIERGYSEVGMVRVHRRLSQPLAEVDYETQRTFDFQFGRGNFTFTLSKPGEEDMAVINSMIGLEMMQGREPLERNTEHYLKIDSAKLRIDAEEIDLYGFLPSSGRIFIVPSKDRLRADGFMAPLSDSQYGPAILVIGDLTTPFGIDTLFHEIGHVVDGIRLNDSEWGEFNAITEHPHARQAAKIRSERAANAFALDQLRKFVDDPQMRSDLRHDLVHYALHSHYQGVKDEIRKKEDGANAMSMSPADVEWTTYSENEQREQEMFDDFWKWKDTPAYTAWKARPEFKDIPKYDEYNAWAEWIEKTNYDYHKDLSQEDLEP